MGKTQGWNQRLKPFPTRTNWCNAIRSILSSTQGLFWQHASPHRNHITNLCSWRSVLLVCLFLFCLILFSFLNWQLLYQYNCIYLLSLQNAILRAAYTLSGYFTALYLSDLIVVSLRAWYIQDIYLSGIVSKDVEKTESRIPSLYRIGDR